MSGLNLKDNISFFNDSQNTHSGDPKIISIGWLVLAANCFASSIDSKIKLSFPEAMVGNVLRRIKDK